MARMLPYNLVFVGLLSISQAIQPSTPAAPAGKLRSLPLGQLNFLHTTDTHGWHAGHLQEASYGADWGDYISFSQRLREKIEAAGNDLLLIDTGDRVEGNGLYDASLPTGKYTRQIFPQQNIDILCLGNHELYKGNTSNLEFLDLVPAYGSNYLASNVDITDPRTGERVPFAQRFRKFTTKNHGIRVTAFGFLFNFSGNAKNTVVKSVEDVVKEQWFLDAIEDSDVDIFVVIGHIGLWQTEFQNIHKAIRAVREDMPIMLFGGHSHIRDYRKYDDKAYGLQSGRYMETIGFQSVSGLPSRADEEGKLELRDASYKFARRYIDNNLFSFHNHTGLDESSFPTAAGLNVSALITEARKALNLDERFGCNPRPLWMSRAPYPGADSIYSWLQSRVIPEMVIDSERKDKTRFIYANTGAMRFDIFAGPFTRDTTFIVSPFTSGFRFIKDVPFSKANGVLKKLTDYGTILAQSDPSLQEWRLKAPEQMDHNLIKDHRSTAAQAELIKQKEYLSQFSPENPPPTPGYTTCDVDGCDGDDTEHSKILKYKVPNCIESRVTPGAHGSFAADPAETVDIVYLEFIQPWILKALGDLGVNYTVSDTARYANGTGFTPMIAEWVHENWKC